MINRCGGRTLRVAWEMEIDAISNRRRRWALAVWRSRTEV